MGDRILLLQLKRIGDTILTAPASAALRRQLPTAKQTLVVSGASAQLSTAFNEVDQVLHYVPGRANATIWGKLVTGRFSHCFDFSGTDRSALMSRLSGAAVRVGYRKFAEAKRHRLSAYTKLSDASVRDLHTVDFHLALAAEIGETPADGNSGFSVPESATDAADRILHEHGVPPAFAVIHPGTARTEKYWIVERWAAVIDHLKRQHGLASVITGNPDDPEEAAHLQDLSARTGSQVRSLAGKLDLLELAAVIGRSTMALGVDSAAMHLAAMLHKPQIVLFGPTNPFHWRPRHENASVLLAGNESLNMNALSPKCPSSEMPVLSTDQVCRAIDARLTSA